MERNLKTNRILKWMAENAHYFLTSIFLVIVIRSCVNSIMDWDRLMRTRIITMGTVAGADKISRNPAIYICYWFEVDGEIFNCKMAKRIRFSQADTLVGMHFPIAYEKGNPENSEIIITPEDFKEFKLPFPDSLRWIRKIQFY